ncbi:MAG: precorrin-4 C(11)-methyltransferase [Lachnospiraceae bacterium]|nr:precorrin-4 C(11)-methyltransferase [Lachnospiraceae bacterium]
MIYFVGAGPGAVDLITVKGMELIKKADVIIYAGSLVNPKLLEYARNNPEIYNSAEMTLEEVMEVMIKAAGEGKKVVRLHTGEPSIYGAVREQMDILDEKGINYSSCPGVSACFGAAADMNLEYTLPGISQTLIITRLEGRTGVPGKERISLLSEHCASMAVYLSAGMTERLSEELIKGGYSPDTPAAIVYKATWDDEKIVIGTVSELKDMAERENISKTAVVLVGEAIKQAGYERSRLYDPAFSTEFRRASKSGQTSDTGKTAGKAT